MQMPAVAIVLGRVIAEQSQIKKVGRLRKELKRGEVSLIQGAGIGPDPANAIGLKAMDDVRAMPAGMPKLNRESVVTRKLFQERAQGSLAVLWCKRRWQL